MSPRYHFGSGQCPTCNRTCALNANGRIHAHNNPPGTRCDGVGKNPATQPEETTP